VSEVDELTLVRVRKDRSPEKKKKKKKLFWGGGLTPHPFGKDDPPYPLLFLFSSDRMSDKTCRENPNEHAAVVACELKLFARHGVGAESKWDYRMSAFGSGEALDNWADDGKPEIHKGIPPGPVIRPSCHKGKDLELFADLAAEAGSRRPLSSRRSWAPKPGCSSRAIAWDSTEDIVGR